MSAPSAIPSPPLHEPERPPVATEIAIDGSLALTGSSANGSSTNGALPVSFWLSPPAMRREWLRAHRGQLRRWAHEDIARAIVLLDEAITEQLNAILHHPDFQKLESSWRGLRFLAEHAAVEDDHQVKVKVLNASWDELRKDAEKARDFDRTQLFHKVYDEEFGMPGGEPYGVLIGDYEIAPRPSPERPIDDVEVLTSVGRAASAAFAPFICGANPSLLGMESFRQLERQPEIDKLFQGPDYAPWRQLRRSEDSKFIGITLPRILMRLPYERMEAVLHRRYCRACQLELVAYRKGECDACGAKFDRHAPDAFNSEYLGFHFQEDVAGPVPSKYLWGSAAWAFGAVLIRAFARSGWLADIRGFDRNVDGGGLVAGLTVQSFGLDAPDVAPKMSIETALDGFQEKVLSDNGLIPLSRCHDTAFSVFFSNHSLHHPPVYDTEAATLNARVSAQLQYTLCVSRFAHYLKVIIRDRIGRADAPEQLANDLKNWISEYVTPNAQASSEIKARYPLREAEINVQEVKGQPGKHVMVMKLWPHYQLDDLRISLRFATALETKK